MIEVIVMLGMVIHPIVVCVFGFVCLGRNHALATSGEHNMMGSWS